jgi:hypothetical protein
MARARAYFVFIVSSRSGVCLSGAPATWHGEPTLWYDVTPNSRAMVEMEREVKSWRRERKVRLIEATNPGWHDLAVDWLPRNDEQDPSLRSG